MCSAALRRIAWPVAVEPGERELLDVGMRDERRTGRRAVAVDDVEHAGGHPGRDAQGSQLRRRKGRLLGHLEDDRVPDREGRSRLPAGQQERIVPWADRADDAVRFADRIDEVAGIGGVRASVRQFGVAGEVGEEVGGQVDLGDRLPDGLAGVARLDRPDPVGVGPDQVGEPAQDGGTMTRCGLRPGARFEHGPPRRPRRARCPRPPRRPPVRSPRRSTDRSTRTCAPTRTGRPRRR